MHMNFRTLSMQLTIELMLVVSLLLKLYLLIKIILITKIKDSRISQHRREIRSVTNRVK